MKLNRKEFLSSLIGGSSILLVNHFEFDQNQEVEFKILEVDKISSINRLFPKEEVKEALKKEFSTLITLTDIKENQCRMHLFDVVGELNKIYLKDNDLILSMKFIKNEKFNFLNSIGIEKFDLRPISSGEIIYDNEIQVVRNLSFIYFNFIPKNLASQFS